MAKKIHVITLKEQDFAETEGGEFVEVFKNAKRYPVYLTNYALAKGYDMGLINSTLIGDLLNIKTEEEGANKKEQAKSLMKAIDERKVLHVIFLAFMGANPRSEIGLDEFLRLYHATFEEKIELYMNIVTAVVQENPNAFAKSLENSTQRVSSKEKK